MWETGVGQLFRIKLQESAGGHFVVVSIKGYGGGEEEPFKAQLIEPHSIKIEEKRKK